MNHKFSLSVGKSLLAIVAAASISVPATADTSVLSLRTRELMERLSPEAARNVTSRSGGKIPDIDPDDPASSSVHVPVIMMLESATSELPDYVVELHRRDNLALAMIPYGKIAELETSGPVVRVETGLKCSATLDKARTFTNYEKVASGEGLPKAFTGEGVVVGFTDIGFDPNHINFTDPETGELKVKRLIDYSVGEASCVTLDTEESIREYRTDDAAEWHATHVAGILAGNYTENGYQGIAPGADIVATTSPLYDAFLLSGCEEVIAYAKEQGKPAVINMSISSASGPHDGSSLFNRYMEKMTEEDAIVCISSGNTGHMLMNVLGTFSAENPVYRSYIHNSNWSDEGYGGTVDVWSDDDTPVTCRLVIYDRLTHKLIAQYPVVDGVDTKEYMICSSSLKSSYPSAANDSILDKVADGYARFTCEVNPLNNRFNILVSFDFYNLTCTSGNSWADYAIGLEFGGRPGQSFSAYGSESIFFSTEYDSACVSGVAENAANDFCFGNGVVSVGAFVSRESSSSLDGGVIENKSFTVNDVAYFSSFGEKTDGAKVPVVVAPGADVISSVSRYYYENHPDVVDTECSSMVEADGERYLWGPHSGTSMSSPYVAGVIATWLEANPTLTTADVLDILSRTNTEGPTNSDNPQWGGGFLDSYAGLKAAIAMSGVADVNSDLPSGFVVTPAAEGGYEVKLLSGILARASLTDLSGKMAMETVLSGQEARIDCSSLSAGVYVLTVTDSRGDSHSEKIAVR